MRKIQWIKSQLNKVKAGKGEQRNKTQEVQTKPLINGRPKSHCINITINEKGLKTVIESLKLSSWKKKSTT